MTTDGATDHGSQSQLAATASLLGVLLQREIDGPLVERLRASGVADALEAWGIELPEPDDPAALDELAATYFDAFVSPRHEHPLIQSLTQGGAYEGPPVRSIREIAEQLGLSRNDDAALGSPPDHLGSALELWAEILTRAPAQAPEFAQTHLAWALPSLRRTASGDGFYARLCAVVADFIEDVLAASPTRA